jgi:hypothetical protein
MSRQFRHRVTAVVLGGLLLGAPLLTNGTANAGQVEGGGRQVVFGGGGMLGLSCSSKPDLESMTVPPDSTVVVVNRTGHNARLLLGGAEKGAIADNGSAQVLFRRGTTAVTLDPDCTLGDEATPSLVTAAPSTPAGVPGPIPVPPSATPATDAATSGAGSPPTSTAGVTLPDSPGLSASRPQHATAGAITPGASRPGVVRPGFGSGGAATTAAEAMPPGGVQLRLKATTGRRTTGAAGPAFAGMPPGGDKTLVPAVPSLDLVPATEAAPAAPAVPTMEIAAAEPVAAMEPMSPERPIGLLALVAAVCAVGVGVGAIRAFAAQRASRAKIA